MASLAPSASVRAIASPLSDADASLSHGRYRLEGIIGEGGMATVYAALDHASGQRVALKRLRCDNPDKRAALTALFEREFLALSELAHPRIVAVYDYGVDDDGPYYTMELLDGGDLRRIAPADHRVACALARDVCSALSLVHARRMVFRDLSPNNVRRTGDGLAKLIDFGGLVPMGPRKDMVGTLPCVPPEALNQQPLDARTDLYALGATLYFTLVGRHAYPARDLTELTQLWRQQPLRPPSDYVQGIPPALDRLVLDLLQLDPARRPGSAAEVMERLSAVAQLRHDESLLVEQAYLATPALVARERELRLIREHVARAKLAQGASVLITGPSGVGRTRLLDTAALEAKLAGLLVLRATAEHTQRDYDAVRALARSMLEQAPRLARAHARSELTLLGHIVPELSAPASEPTLAPSDDPEQLQQRIQPVLLAWFRAVARERPLLLAIDDIDRIDAASLALLALLARELAPHALLLIATKASAATQRARPDVQGALRVLARVSQPAKLRPLRLERSQALLGSMFGEVPHLALLTQHVQRVTTGIPRDIIGLARHLIREGLIRYQAGAWSLPQRLSAKDLPANMAEALALRVQKLGPEARALGYLLAAEPQQSFSLASCALLLDLPSERVLRCVKELASAELLLHSGDVVRAAESAKSAPLVSALDEATRRHLHAQLALEYTRRGDTLRTAQHLLHAGEDQRGVDALVAYATESIARTNESAQAFHEILRSLPDDWLAAYEHALQICDSTRRPLRDKRALLRQLTGLFAHASGEVDGSQHFRSMLQGLAHDAGLDLLEALPDTMGTERIKLALGQARARYDSAPEAERGYDPRSALQELAGQTLSALGALAYTNSYAAWSELPSLAPLCALSPAIALVHALSRGVGLRIGGRSEAALALYEGVLERLAAPDRGGLDASHHVHSQTRVMGAVATLEAAMGHASSLRWAERIAASPGYESVALLIEQLYHLYQSNPREARRLEQRLELLRLQGVRNHANEAHFEFSVLCAYALGDDLTGVKRSVDAMASRAKLHPSFRAALGYGRAEYQRIRGDHAAALAQLEATLPLMEPGKHLLWSPAAAAHVRALLELGRGAEAVSVGRVYLTLGEGLGYMQSHVQTALSLALGRSGNTAEAVQLCDATIERLAALGVTGLVRVLAHEVRAQLALLQHDDESYRHNAAAYDSLMPSGGRRLRGSQPAEPEAASPAAEEQSELETLSQFKSSLESCLSFFDRARAGIEFVGRRAGARGAVLFTHTEQGLVRTASYGAAARDRSLDTLAAEFFKREVTEHMTEDLHVPTLATQVNPCAPSVGVASSCSTVLLAHDDPQGFAFSGVALFIGSRADVQRTSKLLLAELSRAVGESDEAALTYL